MRFFGLIDFFWIFFEIFTDFILMLLILQLKVTGVTTEHQKRHKVSQNSIKSFFFEKSLLKYM